MANLPLLKEGASGRLWNIGGIYTFYYQELMNQAPHITPRFAPDGKVGDAYSFTPVWTYPGVSVKGYACNPSGTPLPPGLSFNSSTGAITGTPTTAGTYGPYQWVAWNIYNTATQSARTYYITIQPSTNPNYRNLTFVLSKYIPGYGDVNLQVQDPANYLYSYPYIYDYMPGPSPVPGYTWSQWYQATFGGSQISLNGGTLRETSYPSPTIYNVGWSGFSPVGLYYIWFYGFGGLYPYLSITFTLTIQNNGSTVYTNTFTVATSPNTVSAVHTFDSVTGIFT